MKNTDKHELTINQLEVGKIYLENSSTNEWATKVIQKEPEVLGNSFNMSKPIGKWSVSYAKEYPCSLTATYTEATDEQKLQLLTAMADHGDATDDDLKLLSELMPLDNPEIKEGQVYYTFAGSCVRAIKGDTQKTGLSGNYLHIKSNWFIKANGSTALIKRGYRKALPHEVLLLEQAEKEHGCVYAVESTVINEEQEMTEERVYAPKIVGRKYKVISGLVFNRGDIVTLVEDDGTDCPRFENKDGLQRYKGMYNVELLPEETHKQPVSQRNSTAFLGSKYLLTITGLTADTVTVNCINTESSIVFKNQKFSTDSLFYKNMKPATPDEETVIKQLLEPQNELFVTGNDEDNTIIPVKFKKGQVWEVYSGEWDGYVKVEVTSKSFNNSVQVKYEGLFGTVVSTTLTKDDHLWEDATLVSEGKEG